jgi:hypothetical protein
VYAKSSQSVPCIVKTLARAPAKKILFCLTVTRMLVRPSVPLKQKKRKKEKEEEERSADCLFSISKAQWKFNQLQGKLVH